MELKELRERGVVSFPKCGRTWIRLFIEYYRRFTDLDFSKMPIIFRHDDKFDYERCILLIRHPCDVMVSYHVHKTTRGKAKVAISAFVRNKRVGIPAFNHSYTAWSERTDDQLVVRYEDMFQPEVWADMLEFFDIPFFQDGFDQAIAKTQFDTIRGNLEEIATFPTAWRYLAAEYGNYSVLEPNNPEAHKFRRGKVGGYVDYLCTDDIIYILDNFTLGKELEPYRQQYMIESEIYHA